MENLLTLTKPEAFILTADMINIILNDQGPFTADYLMSLYQMCEDETCKETFVSLLALKYQKVTCFH